MTAPRSPYKGLSSFDESDDDARFFFGREREREIVAANMMAARLTFLYGETGVGKSSILRAGVVHHLRDQPEPGGVVVFDDWRDDPAAALRHEVATVAGLTPADSLSDTVEASAAIVGGEIFVILDGFEEYFLYHGADGRSSPFLEDFSDAVNRPGLRVAFLVAIREDALAKIDRFKARIPNLFGNYLRLDHLDRAAAEEAIRGPVERFNQLDGDRPFEIEPALVAAVLDQVAAGKVEIGRSRRAPVQNGGKGERIEAPFLQLVMARVWEAESDAGSHVLRWETLTRLGGAEQIVRDHLEGALGALEADEQDTAAGIFRHLVTPSGAKIAHDASDLAGYVGDSSARVEPVLATLAAERILRPVPGRFGSDPPRYEIYHDILGEPVLAWCARHESERQVARVREAAAKRHRRLLVIAGAAVLLAGAMAGLAIFAYTQRTIAQRAVAELKQKNAELGDTNTRLNRANAKLAETNQALNEANSKLHSTNTKLGHAKAKLAKTNRALNQANSNLATTNEKLHRANAELHRKNQQLHSTNQKLDSTIEKLNQTDAKLAETNQALNEANSKLAATNGQLKQTNSKLHSTNQELHSTNQKLHSTNQKLDTTNKQLTAANKVARAGELIGTALSELINAPEAALVDDVQAAAIDPTAAGLENALRRTMLASRVQAILPVDGVTRSAAVSSGVPPAGSHESRVISVSRNDSVLAVGDDSGLRLYRIPSGKVIRTLDIGAPVGAVAFSPDGSLVAAASRNGYVTIWEVASGRRLGELNHGGRPVRSLAFSHDGQLLATACNDRRVRIWRVGTWQPTVQPIPHPRAVSLVSFSPDDRLLLTVDGESARLVDVTSGVIVKTLTQLREQIRTAAFSPDGKIVATGGMGTPATAQLWSVPAGKPVGAPLTGHQGDILGVSFSRDGKLLVTASADDTARVWSVPDGRLVATLGGHGNQVRTASFSPDGKWIVTGSRDSTARVWETSTGTTISLLAGDRGTVTGAFFTTDGRWVVSTSDDGSARIWDPGTDPELKSLGTHAAAVTTVSISPDGRFALSTGADGTVKVWPLSGGQGRTFELGGRVMAASWSSDGKLVLAASDNGMARVWRVVDGRIVATLTHGAPIQAAAFDRDAARVVTGGADGVARVWKTAGGGPLETLHPGGSVTAVSFSPDGSLVATAGEDGLGRLWRAEGGRLVRTLRGHSGTIVALEFSPNGKWLATAGVDATARMWNVDSGVATAVMHHGAALTSLAFSPDGTQLVTASFDHNAIVWRVPDGRRLRVLSGHSAVISDVAFSSDGRWIVTAGPTKAGLWDARARSLSPPLLYLGGTGKQLTGVAFSPKGWRVVTGSKDGSVATYDCRLCGGLQQLVALAKARLAGLEHDLTARQRRRYLGG